MSSPTVKKKRTLPSWMKKTDAPASAKDVDDEDSNISTSQGKCSLETEGGSSRSPEKRIVRESLSDEEESDSVSPKPVIKRAQLGKDSAEVKPDADPATCHDSSLNTGVSTPPSRQSCFYGSSCYRKNPQHRIDLAHPGDSDFQDQTNTTNDRNVTADNRPLCEYGAACYRKNPQHRRDFRHDAPAKRKARPNKLQDIPSDNDGDFDGSISSDNYNPDGSESNDSFVTSDSMESGNSDFDSDDEGESKKKTSKKRKKTQRKDSKKKTKETH